MAIVDVVREPRRVAAVGRPRKLTAEAIVQAALEITDELGPERLSIRALAARLNAQATAIYTHFENLEAIEAAVVEKLLLGLPVPDATLRTPLREQLIEHFEALRDAHIAHPRINVSISRVGSPAWNRNAMHLDGVLAQLVAHGVELVEAQLAYSALAGVTVMSAMLINAYRSDSDPATVPRRALAALKAMKAGHVLKMMTQLESKHAGEDSFRVLVGSLIDRLLPKSVARANNLKASRRG